VSSIDFHGEIPVPRTNVDLYGRLYVTEQWLRRIAYAALVTHSGAEWKNALPSELARDLRSSAQKLVGRTYLNVENSDNLIWLLTLDELLRVLLADHLWPGVKALTGLKRDVLSVDLRRLREIRNVVGHNRAISPLTAEIARGIEAALTIAIERFKRSFLYAEEHKVVEGNLGDALTIIFFERTRPGDLTRFQPMMSASDQFYSLTTLPVERLGGWDSSVSLGEFMHAARPVQHLMMAVLVNKLGGEFGIT